jgi:adenylate cyclase
VARSANVSQQFALSPDIPSVLSPDPVQDPAFAARVTAQLDAILVSPMFDASERNRRFLRYIVEETLANGGTRIKGYSVGISVFDREANFDPQIDPVVRIEAGRLRRSLERYYLTDGRCASVRISVPKGGYVPLFEVNAEGRAPASAAEPVSDVPRYMDRSVFVLPFKSISSNDASKRFAAGLSEEVIVEFGKHREVNIFTLPCLPIGDHAEFEILKAVTVRLILGGTIRLNPDRVRVIAHLVDHRDNRHLWSASIDRKLKRGADADLERDIGHEIVSRLLAQQPSANGVWSRQK